MLKYASKLPDDYEYALIWWGQSNAIPQGGIQPVLTDPSALDESPQMELDPQGIDLRIDSISGTTITLSSAQLTEDEWIGAEVRLIYTQPNYTDATERIGYGTVSDNTDTTITVSSWDVDPASVLPDESVTCTFTNTSTTITASGAHKLLVGDEVTFGSTVGTTIVAGTKYYVESISGLDFTVMAAFDGAAIEADDNAAGVTISVVIGGYLRWTSERRTYPNVRVLMPYMPEGPTYSYPTGDVEVPGYSYPSTITSYEDVGAFTDFAYQEGVDGVGGSGTSTDVTGLVVTDGGASWTSDLYIGGRIQIGTAWGEITDNDATTITVSAWNGTAPTTGDDYEFSVPHWRDNPHYASPGFGMRTGSNWPIPVYLPQVYNRPRGNVATGGSTTVSGRTMTYVAATPYFGYGSMVECAWRLSQAIGQRVNVIHLGKGSAGMLRDQTTSGFLGLSGTDIGWYTKSVYNDFVPEMTDNLAARLEKMITTIAPAALTAEGNTKPLRVLGVVGFQGETDATTEVGRENYKRTLPGFINWIRGVVHGAGLSYYSRRDSLPVVHANLPSTPWEATGSDEDGEVNAVIENLPKIGFADYCNTEDSDKKDADSAHFDGVGEAKNGRLAYEALLPLIDEAASAEEDLNEPVAIEICNMALSHIGDVAKITSLDTSTDTSVQASYCNKFYSQARKSLLQGQAWAFATRRSELKLLTGVRDEEWSHAYAVPNNAVRVFAVLPPEAGDDISSGVRGTATVQDDSGAYRTRTATNYVPLRFTIEQDEDGHKVIYTTTEDAVARYNVLITDAEQYPPLFVECLALKLASMLVGPLVKGQAAMEVRSSLMQQLEFMLGKAKVQDAIQSDIKPEHMPPMIRARW